jgi:hypothetical protein
VSYGETRRANGTRQIESQKERAVESHISRKTSEMWGTRRLLPVGQKVRWGWSHYLDSDWGGFVRGSQEIFSGVGGGSGLGEFRLRSTVEISR